MKWFFDKGSYSRGLALGLIVVLFLLVGQACNGTEDLATKEVLETIVFSVQRLDPEVFTGTSPDDMALLAAADPQPLPEGHRVSTDSAGQALLQGQLPNNQTCQIYLFQLTSLTTKACPRSNYQGGNTATCQEENTAVYKECKGNLQMTPSGEVEVVGSWLSLTYLPDRQLTLVIVGEGVAQVRPVTEFDTRALGDPIRVEAQQFLYTAPDAVLEEISGLPPREPLPLNRLMPLIRELALEPWLERLVERARLDDVPFLLEPEGGTPTATGTPEQLAQVTPEPTLTAIPTPCLPPASWVPYTVQPGENLFRIALRYGMTAQALQEANCLSSAGEIRSGQTLYVPYYVSPTPTRCVPRRDWVPYTVQPGETLSRIAARYGLSVEALRRGSCLESNLIYVGQILYVPYLIPPVAVTTPVTPEIGITAPPTDAVTPPPGGLFVVHGGYGPLQDIRVQEAIASAVDWTTILKEMFPDKKPVATLVFPDLITTTDQVVFDLERSRQLLYDAGYGDGFLIHLLASQEDPDLVDISEWIYSYLYDLGLQIHWQTIAQAEALQAQIEQYSAQDEAILWVTWK